MHKLSSAKGDRQLARRPSFRSLLSFCFVVSLFVPYLGLPLGDNTHIPVSSILSLAYISPFCKNPRALLAALALVGGPLVLALISVVLGREIHNASALLVAPIYILPGFAVCALAARQCDELVTPIRIALTVAITLGLLQEYYFFPRGFLPFLSYYGLPGYASVENNLDAILNFIQRPFSLFPEPSFMAGVLALSTCLLGLITASIPERAIKLDALIVLGACVLTFLSESGSAVISICIMLLCYYYPRLKPPARPLALLGCLAVGAAASVAVIGTRSGVLDFSWGDRAASIGAAIRFLLSDSAALLIGIGKGVSSQYYRDGTISLAGFNQTADIPDVYSVLVRMVLEQGLIFGAGSIVLIAFLVWRGAVKLLDKVLATAVLTLWLVVSGLTITYDSAAWLWAFPGFFIGVLLRDSWSDADVERTHE